MTQFSYAGNDYAIGLLDVFAQADIAAKLTPLLGPFAELAKQDGTIARLMEPNAPKGEILSVLFGNIEKLTTLIAKMPSEDRRMVMETCFSCVSRKGTGGVGWQPIWNSQAGRLQYDDLNSLPAAMAICGNVISDKLKSFFPASPPA